MKKETQNIDCFNRSCATTTTKKEEKHLCLICGASFQQDMFLLFGEVARNCIIFEAFFMFYTPIYSIYQIVDIKELSLFLTVCKSSKLSTSVADALDSEQP